MHSPHGGERRASGADRGDRSRRRSFDMASGDGADSAAEYSVLRLRTGTMSFWFAAYTLACSQIGSTLVSVSVFVGGLGLYLGCVATTFLGLAAWLAVYYAGEVWLLARRAALAERGVKQAPGAVVAGYGAATGHDAEGGGTSVAFDTPQAVAGPVGGANSDANADERLMYGDLIQFVLQRRLRGWANAARIIVWMQYITVFMQVISLGGTAVSEVIQTGVNVYVMTGTRSPRFWAGLFGGLIMTPLTWLPSFESLSWLSLVAILAVLYTAMTIVVESVEHGIHPDLPLPEPTLVTSFLSLSDMIFIWGSLAMVPEVQSSMADPRRLAGAYGVDVVYTLLVILPTAVTELWAFQGGVSSNILQQLHANIGTKVAAALLSLHMVIAFAVLLAPVMESAERGCGLRAHGGGKPREGDATGGGNARRSRSSKVVNRLQRVALRTAIALFCVFLALAFPFFSDVVGVISAISQTYLTFLAPPYMWLFLFGDAAWRGEHRAVVHDSAGLAEVAADAAQQPARGDSTGEDKAAAAHPLLGHGADDDRHAKSRLRSTSRGHGTGVGSCGSVCHGRALVAGAYTMMVLSTVLGLGLGTWASAYSLIQNVAKFGVFSSNK